MFAQPAKSSCLENHLIGSNLPTRLLIQRSWGTFRGESDAQKLRKIPSLIDLLRFAIALSSVYSLDLTLVVLIV